MVVRKPRLGDVHHAFKAKNLDRLFEPISFGPGNKFHLNSTYFINKIEKLAYNRMNNYRLRIHFI
jgi:hypothetical protein